MLPRSRLRSVWTCVDFLTGCSWWAAAGSRSPSRGSAAGCLGTSCRCWRADPGPADAAPRSPGYTPSHWKSPPESVWRGSRRTVYFVNKEFRVWAWLWQHLLQRQDELGDALFAAEASQQLVRLHALAVPRLHQLGNDALNFFFLGHRSKKLVVEDLTKRRQRGVLR